MNKGDRNVICLVGFILIVIGCVLLGNYLIKNNKNDNGNSNTEDKVLVKKIDEDKDYVYFDNDKIISEEGDLVYRDIHFNFDSEDAKNLEEELNNNMSNVRDSVLYLDDIDYDSDELIYNNDNIYKADIISYDVFKGDSYVTVLVSKYSYNAFNDYDDNKLDCYTFDLYTGNLLDNNGILKNYNLTNTDVRNAIYDGIKEIDDIDIDATMNSNYTLYVGEYNKVWVKISLNKGNSSSDYNIVIS